LISLFLKKYKNIKKLILNKIKLKNPKNTRLASHISEHDLDNWNFNLRTLEESIFLILIEWFIIDQ
jgi:hypothetical protein